MSLILQVKIIILKIVQFLIGFSHVTFEHGSILKNDQLRPIKNVIPKNSKIFFLILIKNKNKITYQSIVNYL